MKKVTLLIIILFALISCDTTEARRPISHTSGSTIKTSVERNKQLIAQERSTILALIAKDSTNKYLTSSSGFWYRYITKIENDSLSPENNIIPKFGDALVFDYKVNTLDGTIIYSNEALKTQNYIMDQQELFSGLREGLKLMKAGETVQFIFPSSKAYGYYGDENKIGANVSLVCEVTLNSINKTEEIENENF